MISVNFSHFVLAAITATVFYILGRHQRSICTKEQKGPQEPATLMEKSTLSPPIEHAPDGQNFMVTSEIIAQAQSINNNNNNEKSIPSGQPQEPITTYNYVPRTSDMVYELALNRLQRYVRSHRWMMDHSNKAFLLDIEAEKNAFIAKQRPVSIHPYHTGDNLATKVVIESVVDVEQAKKFWKESAELYADLQEMVIKGLKVGTPPTWDELSMAIWKKWVEASAAEKVQS